ncbi:hypothetical protein NKH77_38935 [Streptomyces sp. M19]
MITRYWFRSPGATGSDPRRLLPNPPSQVLVANVSWPWSKITEAGFRSLVETYGTWLENNSGPDSPYADLCSWLMLNHRSVGHTDLLVQMDATVPDASELLREFCASLSGALGLDDAVPVPEGTEERAESEFSTILRLPWLRATRYIGTIGTTQTDPNMRGKHKSAYHRKGLSGTRSRPFTTI